ncbi:MAG: cyclic pyranopterin monophosphate synthase MoaC [Spirochaetaceae bacterium]|jgi:cyclic pyranopterin phosphate synthase|nr:cyclic pyranopterin monophosphate synthase MoaC [Spirochaetaceae bacterium]
MEKRENMENQGFTHLDEHGNAVMADVSGKDITARAAKARGRITMSAGTLRAVRQGVAAKGDVLGAARIAGIMAAKRTADLIPLCHPLIFDTCAVDFALQEVPAPAIEAVCSVKLSGKTGAEMEALTGAAVALLTIYDMCKALDRSMVIREIRLVEKSGGASGLWTARE